MGSDCFLSLLTEPSLGSAPCFHGSSWSPRPGPPSLPLDSRCKETFIQIQILLLSHEFLNFLGLCFYFLEWVLQVTSPAR